MRYFPILGELFSSDSIVFFLLGMAIALILCLKMREGRGKAALLALVLYAVCEALSKVPAGSYLLELVLLFVGTIALGACAGFVVGWIFKRMKTQRGKERGSDVRGK